MLYRVYILYHFLQQLNKMYVPYKFDLLAIKSKSQQLIDSSEPRSEYINNEQNASTYCSNYIKKLAFLISKKNTLYMHNVHMRHSDTYKYTLLVSFGWWLIFW